MFKARRILKNYAFALSGAGTTDVTLNADDLTDAEMLVCQIDLTSAAADATDKLNIELQETINGVNYNTRMRFNEWLGNQTASAGTPASQRQQIVSHDQLASTEQAYVPTGSAGGADLAKGSGRNGPFVGFYRNAAGRHAGMRLEFAVTSGNAAVFAGTINVWAYSRE